jgi:hypothetical protein
MQISGIVNPPSSTSNPDASQPVALMGKAAELIVAELHGKWYTAAYRGRVFHGATNIAGTTITTQSTTTSSFMLYNPLGTGVNAELISTDIGMIGSTTVIATILQAVGQPIITNVTTTVTVLISANPFNGAAGTNRAQLTTLATLSAAMTFFYPLFNITTTADIAVGNLHYDWDGRLILAPGSATNLGSNITQSAAFVCSYDWAEWPA